MKIINKILKKLDGLQYVTLLDSKMVYYCIVLIEMSSCLFTITLLYYYPFLWFMYKYTWLPIRVSKSKENFTINSSMFQGFLVINMYIGDILIQQRIVVRISWKIWNYTK